MLLANHINYIPLSTGLAFHGFPMLRKAWNATRNLSPSIGRYFKYLNILNGIVMRSVDSRVQ